MYTTAPEGYLGINTSNPGVFQSYPHLYPRKPVPVQVHHQNQLRNLATTVQVSIDTSMQHCEVKYSGGRYVDRHHSSWCLHFILGLCFVFVAAMFSSLHPPPLSLSPLPSFSLVMPFLSPPHRLRRCIPPHFISRLYHSGNSLRFVVCLVVSSPAWCCPHHHSLRWRLGYGLSSSQGGIVVADL